MLKKNVGIFKGLVDENGQKCVTFNAQPLNPQLERFNHSRVGLDWGYHGSGALQLSFAIIYRVEGKEVAKPLLTQFSKEVVAKLDKNWELTSQFVKKWLANHKHLQDERDFDIYTSAQTPANNPQNVVKRVCLELKITQKRLAEILEVPEGTVSSWAVRDELPRLAKKAIEFYIEKERNDTIVKQFKNLIALVS